MTITTVDSTELLVYPPYIVYRVSARLQNMFETMSQAVETPTEVPAVVKMLGDPSV